MFSHRLNHLLTYPSFPPSIISSSIHPPFTYPPPFPCLYHAAFPLSGSGPSDGTAVTAPTPPPARPTLRRRRPVTAAGRSRGDRSDLYGVATSGVNRNLNLRNSDFVQCPIRNSVGQWQQALDNFGQSLATPQHFKKVVVFNIDWLLESSAFDMINTFELVTVHEKQIK